MSKLLPKNALQHLIRLTDETGLLQHAKYIIPDRQNGYCTDDNARALVFAAIFYGKTKNSEMLKLFHRYLAFIYHAILPDGSVRNFMGYNRIFVDGEPHHDAAGRTIWALGAVIANPPAEYYPAILKEYLDKMITDIPRMPPRSIAYAVLGIQYCLQKYPADGHCLKFLKTAADSLAALYDKNAEKKWHWFEDVLSYDNSILPAALFTAAKIFGSKKYLHIAQKTCQFLLKNIYNGKHFSFVGSNGWHRKNGKRAGFDQQPIEACGTVIMLNNAYEATKEKEYLSLKKTARQWFYGKNDLNKPLYDAKTGGCCDGLGKDDVNLNQGAESTISFLLSEILQ